VKISDERGGRNRRNENKDSRESSPLLRLRLLSNEHLIETKKRREREDVRKKGISPLTELRDGRGVTVAKFPEHECREKGGDESGSGLSV